MRYCWIIVLLMIAITVQGQDVWTEGTQWVTTYEDGTVETYALKEDTVINDTVYLKLIVEENDSLVGFVRSVVGDTVIHARGIIDDEITEDFLLYDFGTFEIGTVISFSVYNYNEKTISIGSIPIKSDSLLTYYNDVIEEGDILPCYADIVFKAGYLGNPMELFYNFLSTEINNLAIEWIENCATDPNGGGSKPNKKNVSHVVLKPKGKGGGGYVVMYPTDFKPIPCLPYDIGYYDLQGHRLNSIPQKGIYIQKGKKVLMSHRQPISKGRGD